MVEGQPPLPPCAGPIVDADGHIVEPESAWAALPASVRPRISADAAGYEHVVSGDTELLAVPLGNLTRPGSTFDDPSSFRPLADATAGGWDPVARLRDMDSEGIDQAVLYPTIGLYFSAVRDPAAAVALASAYNDWLASYCAAAPRRLFGAAMLPLHDPAAAARELRRAVTELGFVAGFVRPNPCQGRALSDRAYDTVWDAAEELAVPIGIHEGSSVVVPTLGSDRPFNPLILHAMSHPFESMLACAQLIALGTLERHPGLRLLFLESSGAWAPFWLERLDDQVKTFGGFCPDMTLLPSEYFARQCAISFEVDEHTLPALAPFVGPDRIVWGSDYPHHDATFPGAVDAIRATVSPCTTATQAKVLGVNAQKDLPPPGAPHRPGGPHRRVLHCRHGPGPRAARRALQRRRHVRLRRRRATRARGHPPLLHGEHLRVRGLPPRSRGTPGRGHDRDGGHRRPSRRERPLRPRCLHHRRAAHHERSRCAGSPKSFGPPARAERRAARRVCVRQAGVGDRAAAARAAPPSPRRARAPRCRT